MAFGRSIEEFMKRADAAPQYSVANVTREGTGTAVPLKSLLSPEHAFVAYNVAHARTRIRSADGKPYLRILGAFPSREALREHVKGIVADDPGLEIRMAPSGGFFCIGREAYNDTVGEDGAPIPDMVTRTKEAEKAQRMIAKHIEQREADIRETLQNARNARMGKVKLTNEQKLRLNEVEEEASGSSSTSAAAGGGGGAGAAAACAGAAAACAGAAAACAGAAAVAAVAVAAELSTREEGDEGIDSTAPTATASTSGSTSSSTPGVKPLSKLRELRGQQFMAIAIVNDCENQQQHDAIVDAWLLKSQKAYLALRDEFLWKVLVDKEKIKSKEDALAEGHTLTSLVPVDIAKMAEWISINPPPAGYNIWGEYVGPAKAITAKRAASDPEPPAEDEEINMQLQQWQQRRLLAIEEETWRVAGADHVPLQSEILKTWLVENPKPDLNKLAQEEPTVCFLYAGETEEDVQRWMKNAEKASELKHHNMYCVNLYEMLPLQGRFSAELRSEYRNEHLDSIMKSHKEERQKAQKLLAEAESGQGRVGVVDVYDNTTHVSMVERGIFAEEGEGEESAATDGGAAADTTTTAAEGGATASADATTSTSTTASASAAATTSTSTDAAADASATKE